MKKILLTLIAAHLPVPAFALDVQAFRPNHNRGEGLTTYSSSALRGGEWQASIFANYVKNPLEFGFLDNTSRTRGIVDSTSTFNFLFSYALADAVTLGLDFPLHLVSDIQSLDAIRGESNYTPGDPRVFLQIPLLRARTEDGTGLGIAFVPYGTFSLGATGDFLGNQSYVAGGKLVFDAWLGERNYVSLNGGFAYRAEEEVIQNLRVHHEIPLALSYVHVVAPRARIDLIGEVFGATSLDAPFQDEITSPAEALVAARKRWDRWALTAGGGAGLNAGYGAPDYRVFAGVTYAHVGHKKVVDEPEPEPTPEPAPQDGGLSLLIRKENGAPIVAEIVVKSADDKFRDRIKTSEWKRALPPGTYQVSVDVKEYSWIYREFTIEPGQRVSETITMVMPKKKGEKIDVLGKILFDVDQATLQAQSYPILDHVVEVLKNHPEVTKIRIEAHTDSQSSDKYNLSLSNRRAQTVLQYLTQSGIAAARLESRGYGESFPIDSNDTEAGRSNNRRVEFLVLETSKPGAIQNE